MFEVLVDASETSCSESSVTLSILGGIDTSGILLAPFVGLQFFGMLPHGVFGFSGGVSCSGVGVSGSLGLVVPDLGSSGGGSCLVLVVSGSLGLVVPDLGSSGGGSCSGLVVSDSLGLVVPDLGSSGGGSCSGRSMFVS